MLLLLLQQYMNTTEGSSHKSSKNYHMTQSQRTNVPINYILIMGCQEFLQLYFVILDVKYLDKGWMNRHEKGFSFGWIISTKVLTLDGLSQQRLLLWMDCIQRIIYKCWVDNHDNGFDIGWNISTKESIFRCKWCNFCPTAACNQPQSSISVFENFQKYNNQKLCNVPLSSV